MKTFPIYLQRDSMDCGPTCLKMIAEYYGKIYSAKTIREQTYVTRDGVSMLGISDAAESIGFDVSGVQATWEDLKEHVELPCIAHWKQNHFVVVYKIKTVQTLFNFSSLNGKAKYYVYVADPAIGKVKYSDAEFNKSWASSTVMGHCLILHPTHNFYSKEDEKIDPKKNLRFICSYLRAYKRLILQLLLCFVAASLIELALPFLTQSIVDRGIKYSDISFLQLILFAQMALIVGQALSGFMRGWITLHLSTRVSISLISDFLTRLMRLPLSFFDSKKSGDLIQRISDNKRIETFLTSIALPMFFSAGNFFIFGFILCVYDLGIFAIFVSGSLLYIVWIRLFFKHRKELDNMRFAEMSNNQSKVMQLINGMHEIKLNNAIEQKKLEWKKIQILLFAINIRSLKVEQYQQAGVILINNAKNFVITYLAAKSVIGGQITLGMMLAIQYIIGQLNVPINQFLGFLRSWQDAKTSLERLNEIEDKDGEDYDIVSKVAELPSNKEIHLNDVYFQYNGSRSPIILDNINVKIPANKVTAIVGTSGSGKTTLLKLLLGYYTPVSGKIIIGTENLDNLNCHVWRKHIGVVMQDGFIFSDTIARNIAIGEDVIDKRRLLEAMEIANIEEFIESLPLGYNTTIGSEGIGISQGQRQRILIARAVYKNPDFLILDEATSALDANNESQIVENLNAFFKDKTVVIVAHRLSTVKNADNILVLKNGKIVESGSHSELTMIKGEYYTLVKNQLELGD